MFRQSDRYHFLISSLHILPQNYLRKSFLSLPVPVAELEPSILGLIVEWPTTVLDR